MQSHWARCGGTSGLDGRASDELRLLELLDEDPELCEAAFRRIREEVRLVAPKGQSVPEFLLPNPGR